MRNLLLFLFTMTLGLCASAADTELHEYDLNVGAFSRLKVVNNVNVIYSCNPDSAGRAYFRAPREYADLFICSNNDGQLKVESLPVEPGTTGLPTLYVYSRFLSEVTNDSDSTLIVRNVAACPMFKATQVGNGRLVVRDLECTDVQGFLNTGNGTVVLSGDCSNASLKIVGTGLIQADELKADNVKCILFGGGNIGCWPVKELNTKGIGSTRIYYRGDPLIKKRGGGKIYRMDEFQAQ